MVAAGCASAAPVIGQSTQSDNRDHGLEPDDPPVTGGRLVVAVPADVNGWNPSINQWSDGGSLMGPSMIEPLLLQDAGGEPEPFLAESWEPNPDFTRWTITVRDGVRFHNGQLLDAAAVKRSIEAGFQTGLTGIVFRSMFDHVEVNGPRSVTVQLRVPWAQYPWALSSTYMLAPEMLDREDKGTVLPIGTGPFRFKKWVPDSSLEVVRFADYWRRDGHGRQLPYLDQIEFRPIPDLDAREQDLSSGQIDLTLTTSVATARRLESTFTVLRDYTGERTLIGLQNDESPANATNPFTNAHARRALAYATDRDALARTVGEGVQVTTQGYRPESTWALPADQTGYYPYDPEAARHEIELYKTETRRESLKFRLIGAAGQQDDVLLQAVAEQWRHVGADATVETMDQVPFSTTFVLGRYQAALYRWYGDPNPHATVYYHSSEHAKPIGQLSLNFTHYRSPTVDENLRIEMSTTDLAARRAAIGAIVRETNQQAINIWLYDTPYAIIARPTVRGLNNFRMHPFGNFDPKPWWGDIWRAR
jgi:peptide/nickel transport system substrate-binding protein